MGRSFQNKDILKKVYLQDYNLVVARLLLETLSSRNTDGDGDTKTREKIGERTLLWKKFTNIKQHSWKPQFLHCQVYWRYWYSSSVYQGDFM